jgi:hypothetical protein
MNPALEGLFEKDSPTGGARFAVPCRGDCT